MNSCKFLTSPVLATFTSVALIATAAIACQVPVFRYALERWSPDRYELVVLHGRPLNTVEQQTVSLLQKQSSESSANFDVRSFDISQTGDPGSQKLQEQYGVVDEPVVAVLYPRNAQEVPRRLAFRVPLISDETRSLVDSPVRQEIRKRLIDGQSAVWVFVPIGDAKQDEAALAILQREVQRNQDVLELPEQDDVDGEDTLLADVEIDLRLEFSVVTLRREDPKEQHLLSMLMHSESDLMELEEPMAFPVFGRGRVLYALIGKGISEETIGIASRFMIGPCSCQVKDQNPGFDLMMQCDWDVEVGTSKLSPDAPERQRRPMRLTIPPGKKSKSKP